MPMIASIEPSYTGTRECRCSRNAGRTSPAGVSTSRQNMSVRGTITERTSVSSSSKTLWIISRSSRSTTPSLAPTSTSVRTSSSESSGPGPRSLPMRRTVSAVSAPSNERTGVRSAPSQPTGRRTRARNRSGYLTASVIGRTSPKVVRTKIVPRICTGKAKRWPKMLSATSAAIAAAAMLITVIPTSSVTRRSWGRSIRGWGAPASAPFAATRRSRARPSEKYAASAPVRRAETTTSAPRTASFSQRPSVTRAPRDEVLESGPDGDRAAGGIGVADTVAGRDHLADRGESRTGRCHQAVREAREGPGLAGEQELVVLAAAGGPGERVAAEGGGDGARRRVQRYPVERHVGACATLLGDVAEVGGEAVGEVDHRRHTSGGREPAALGDTRPRSQVGHGRLREHVGCEAPGSGAELEERQAGRRAPERSRGERVASPRSVTFTTQPWGDAEVSPPTTATSCSEATVSAPSKNASASSRPVVSGQARATSAQRGRPPMAAMSERFTASDFQPRSAGWAQRRRKCTSSIRRSVVARSRRPAPGSSTAQSSPMPTRTPGRRPDARRMISISLFSVARSGVIVAGTARPRWECEAAGRSTPEASLSESEGGLRQARRGSVPPARSSSNPASLQPDPRIEVRVHHVHDEVHQHERGREQEHGRLDHGIVAVVDRLHGQPPDARPREDRLRDHRAAEERAELDADDRHDRDRGVLERVLPHDGRVRHPLGARRPDVILVQHIEHARPREPRDPRRREEPERDSRQQEVLEAAPPRGGQQVELHGEDQDQHDPEPECGHGLAEQRDDGGDIVDRRVAADRRDDPRRDRERQRDEQCRAGKLERCRHALDHQVEGGLAVAHRLAEVATERTGEETPVLDEERIVESHRLAEAFHVLGRRVRRQEDQRRIAREVEDEEDDEGDAEQDQEGLEEPPDQENLHVPRARRATASIWGVCGNMSTGCTHSSR